MATVALAVVVLLVAALVGGTPAAATAPTEPVVYPHTPHTPPSLGRHPFVSASQLDALLAADTPLVDPTGGVPADKMPRPAPVSCGRRMQGTAHTVRCYAGPPLGGMVLEPPRRATASVVFLHGYTDTPHVYLPLVQVLLSSAPAMWSTVRLVVPFAPRVPVQLVDAPLSDVYAWYDPSTQINSTIGAAAAAGGSADVGATERLLLSDTSDVDRLGLFLSTRRIEAIIVAEQRVLCRARGGRHGGGDPPVGRVVLAGHSLGAVMATHVALTSTARLAGVVALEGFVADVRRLSRVPGTYDRTHRRGYTLELVAGGADTSVPPPLVAASAAIGRRLLRGVARVKYTELPRLDHWSFFLAGADAKAVVGVLRRYLG